MIKMYLSDVGRIITVLLLFLLVFLVARPAMAADKFYTLDRVNLRSGPSTEHEKLRTLQTGVEVTVNEYNPEPDGWSMITYKDLTGYVKSEFITAAVPEGGPTIAKDVSLIEWSEARNIVKVGAPLTITDVYTGLTYYIKSFSNGSHADVEPITTDDTAIMKRTYGGTWDWDPRPVWVTIGDITIAASINGMPHGGGVNNNNGMNGQVCLHFKGSSVHNGNSSYNREMQAAVQTSYNMAP